MMEALAKADPANLAQQRTGHAGNHGNVAAVLDEHVIVVAGRIHLEHFGGHVDDLPGHQQQA